MRTKSLHTAFKPPAAGRVLAHNRYYPYGETITRLTGNPAGNADTVAKAVAARYRFGAKEHETMHGLNSYDFGPRLLSASLPVWDCPDRQQERYHPLSPYSYCAANPIRYIDPSGKDVLLVATNIPGSPLNGIHGWYGVCDAISYYGPTHTFIAVKNENGTRIYSYGPSEIAGSQPCGALRSMDYSSDRAVVQNGNSHENCKAIIKVNPPEGLSVDEFDQRVISVAESFGKNPDINYFVVPSSETEGNCNTSSSTILLKSGVSSDQINEIKSQIPGIATGFSTNAKPWTAKEQAKTVGENSWSVSKAINTANTAREKIVNKANDLKQQCIKKGSALYDKIRSFFNN